jgi:hypothetical protein
MFPVQENVNVVLLEMKTLTSYAGIGFRILLTRITMMKIKKD